MSWSTLSHTRHSVLWDMHEAEVTAGSADSRIGYAQVGMDVSDLHFLHRYAIDPGRALPALSQCLDDSLRRFGTVTLAGLQVALQDLRPLAPDSVIDYVSPRNGFNLAAPAGAQAHIAFDHAWLGDRIGELPDRFPNPGPFEFGPVVTVPAPHRIQGPAETPFLRGLAAARLGLAVTLPEWSASAAGWALALALYTARTLLWPAAPCLKGHPGALRKMPYSAARAVAGAGSGRPRPELVWNHSVRRIQACKAGRLEPGSAGPAKGGKPRKGVWDPPPTRAKKRGTTSCNQAAISSSLTITIPSSPVTTVAATVCRFRLLLISAPAAPRRPVWRARICSCSFSIWPWIFRSWSFRSAWVAHLGRQLLQIRLGGHLQICFTAHHFTPA